MFVILAKFSGFSENESETFIWDTARPFPLPDAISLDWKTSSTCIDYVSGPCFAIYIVLARA